MNFYAKIKNVRGDVCEYILTDASYITFMNSSMNMKSLPIWNSNINDLNGKYIYGVQGVITNVRSTSNKIDLWTRGNKDRIFIPLADIITLSEVGHSQNDRLLPDGYELLSERIINNT